MIPILIRCPQGPTWYLRLFCICVPAIARVVVIIVCAQCAQSEFGPNKVPKWNQTFFVPSGRKPLMPTVGPMRLPVLRRAGSTNENVACVTRDNDPLL